MPQAASAGCLTADSVPPTLLDSVIAVPVLQRPLPSVSWSCCWLLLLYGATRSRAPEGNLEFCNVLRDLPYQKLPASGLSWAAGLASAVLLMMSLHKQ
jgi:hypothetical protein